MSKSIECDHLSVDTLANLCLIYNTFIRNLKNMKFDFVVKFRKTKPAHFLHAVALKCAANRDQRNIE